MENGNIRYVKFAGGLGNMLFQYFFGLYLVRKFGGEIRFFNVMDPIPGEKALKMLCHGFTELDNSNRCCWHYPYRNLMLYRIVRRILRSFPKMSQKIRVENGSQYIPNLRPSYQIYDGYWQSYRYIYDAYKHISFPKEITKNVSVDEIVKTNSVFLHVRRGDYLKYQNIYAICGLTYFKKAMELINQHINHPVFYIFSNDREWVENGLLFGEGVETHFIENEEPFADVKDLYCMSMCKHAVISNSTFSWWAAQLIRNPHKIVIAPKLWYAKEKMNSTISDLIPQDWKQL